MPGTTSTAPTTATMSGDGSEQGALATAGDSILRAIGSIERALDEKINRDQKAAATPDPELARMSETINVLRQKISSLENENAGLRRALDNAGARLDAAITTLATGLGKDPQSIVKQQ